jgi:hypothetical protein
MAPTLISLAAPTGSVAVHGRLCTVVRLRVRGALRCGFLAVPFWTALQESQS